MINVPLEEQETVIRIGRTEDTARIYSSDSTMLTRLHRLGEANSTDWKKVREDRVQDHVVSEDWTCPKDFVSYRTKKPKRTMTDEQRKAAAERMKEVRERGKSS